MVDALDHTAILGLTTNLGFLRRLVASEPFARAAIYTSWLDEHHDQLEIVDAPAPSCRRGTVHRGELPADGATTTRLGRTAGGLAVLPLPTRLTLSEGGERHEWSSGRRIRPSRPFANEAHVEVDGAAWPLEVRGRRHGTASLAVEVDGKRRTFCHPAPNRRRCSSGTAAPRTVFCSATATGSSHESPGRCHRGPAPGLLVTVSVAPGDAVRPGSMLGMLESMKMEYPLKAGSRPP